MNYKVGDKLIDLNDNSEGLIIEITSDGRYRVIEIASQEPYLLTEDEMKRVFKPITDYLTTEDFTKEVEELGYNVDTNDWFLNIYDDLGREIAYLYNDTQYSMSTDSRDYDKLDIDTRKKIYKLLDKAARTPLDKRVAEKREHKLKISHQYFKDVKDGIKTFEIRKNDRVFKVGDILYLGEYDKETEQYTGERLTRKIVYMTDYEQKEGYVVLGIERVEVN